MKFVVVVNYIFNVICPSLICAKELSFSAVSKIGTFRLAIDEFFIQQRIKTTLNLIHRFNNISTIAQNC